MTDVMTRRRLNRATLARQMLLAREEIPVVDALTRLGGLQAQEAKPPFLALWTRLAGFSREDLHLALHGREAVRALFLRATLHLTSAADYAAFRATLQPVMAQAVRVLKDRGQGLDLDRVVATANTILAQEPRTFAELRPLLRQEFPDVDERALGYLVRTHLPLVMVPTGDRWAFPSVAAFTPARTWLSAPLSGDASPQPLVLRYLAAFGPATAADVQTWSGMQGIRGVLDGMRDALHVCSDEHGRELVDVPDAPRPDEDVPAPPRFLPEFDSLVLAHADRTRLLPDEYRGRVVTKNLRVRATFLWDGFVRGTWEVKRKKDAATLHVTAFEPLPARAMEELAAEGGALLRFAEEDATISDVQFGK